jgi:hypothetical protein
VALPFPLHAASATDGTVSRPCRFSPFAQRREDWTLRRRGVAANCELRWRRVDSVRTGRLCDQQTRLRAAATRRSLTDGAKSEFK